jgi:Tfp pilus assembly protein PilO
MLRFHNQHRWDWYYHLIFIIFIILLWWNILPLFSELYSTYSYYRQEKQQLEEYMKIKQKGKLIRKTLHNLKKEFAGRLQPEKNNRSVSGILATIQKIAWGSRIRLTELKPGETKQSVFYQIFPFSVRFTGSFFSGMKFIRDLESNQSRFRIRSIYITTENPLIKQKLNFEVFLEINVNQTGR